MNTFYLQLVNADNPVRMVPESDALLPAHPSCPDILLERRAALALGALLTRLRAFRSIVLVSGMRTMAEQQAIWDSSMKEHGEDYTRKFVALPGCSEHQTGLAVDLAENRPDIDFICPPFPDTGIFREFRLLAPDYGFIQRYPAGKETVTGIAWEPWHFRYVGTPHARIITEQGMVLEEYLRQAEKAAS